MSIRVFSWDSNPSIDPFSYRVSDRRGEEDVSLGRAKFFLMPDGRRAIQQLPPRDYLAGAGIVNGMILCEGRNSCRRVGEGADASYRVKHFSYPIPAWGARNRPMHLTEINNRVPVELLAHASSLNQVQA